MQSDDSVERGDLDENSDPVDREISEKCDSSNQNDNYMILKDNYH